MSEKWAVQIKPLNTPLDSVSSFLSVLKFLRTCSSVQRMIFDKTNVPNAKKFQFCNNSITNVCMHKARWLGQWGISGENRILLNENLLKTNLIYKIKHKVKYMQWNIYTKKMLSTEIILMNWTKTQGTL